ncbi:MAG: TolC family protein [Candidatus Marinimicrobia bacterium]|jgi:OMF family outer membrane factor|nr:TolC family protein [Candidatus Neomarinimicrobiota bacterium]MDD4961314.1 TolC family protein [Candidatus Neomarinimicrobiota bacterium]MDD5709274.1 TolC family protein [Candidatus Neomarinimicrobiota bacterium]MDX9777865.1 TolC family protein [bacterium]
MKKALLLILLIFSLLSARELNLEEAEKLALQNNLQIKLSEASLQKSRAASREALANFFPSITSYFQISDNFELPVNVIDLDGDGPNPPMEIRMGKQFNSATGIQLSYPVFAGGAIINGQLMASAAVNLSELSLQDQVNTILHTIRVLYYQVQMLESLVEATETGLASARENYELALTMESVGKATRLDVLQAKVRYESYKPQLISLRNQKISAVNNLRTYINDPSLEDIRISGKLEEIQNPFAGIPAGELLELAKQKRLDLQMAGEQKRLAGYQRNLAYSSILPKVQIASALQWQGNADAIADLNYRRNSNISLSVSLPLFSGGKNAAGIQKAGIGMKEANYRYEQVSDYISSDVDAACRNVEEAYSSILATADVVSQAEEALRLSKLLYETGSATQLELMSAESVYLSSRSNYISSVFQYNVAVEGLKKALNHLMSNEWSMQ